MPASLSNTKYDRSFFLDVNTVHWVFLNLEGLSMFLKPVALLNSSDFMLSLYYSTLNVPRWA
jgi:hypothetical protein